MNSVAVIEAIYAAFGRGDIPAILAQLHGDVEWEYAQPSTDVPWFQPRRGREAAAGFFQDLGMLEVTKFLPKHVLGTGDIVVAVFDFEATVKATGGRIVETDGVHIWHFSGDKVASFRHRVDTHQQYLAYHGR